MSRAYDKDLQLDLNSFFARFKLGYPKLKVDGRIGKETRERVRDAKHFLGYKGDHNAEVNDQFRWRLKHPRSRHRKYKVSAWDVKRGAQRRSARRKALRARAWDWAWGGCRGVTEEVIRIVGNRAVITSRKRTWGTWGSDHNTAQVRADAVDFGIANAYGLASEIARRLGAEGQWSGDYDSFNIVRKGVTFRVQMIAGTHGTGPHLHVGVRRV